MSADVVGAGLGLRRGFMQSLVDQGEAAREAIDFMEVAPENWIDIGGRDGRRFRAFSERYPFVCHGLSLSLGGPSPLDFELLAAIKQFLNDHRIRCYTEHLSACSDHGHLYDLMPIPFTDEAVRHVAKRVRQTQDFLERRIGIENVSYYAAPDPALTELEFVNAVIDEADCLLLLDVNNIYVNSVNFGYDPQAFLHGLPLHRVAYLHVAGHAWEADDLRIDTHGAAVAAPVWQLARAAFERCGPVPTLLERDFNFPPVSELLGEVAAIRALQNAKAPTPNAAAGG